VLNGLDSDLLTVVVQPLQLLVCGPVTAYQTDHRQPPDSPLTQAGCHIPRPLVQHRVLPVFESHSRYQTSLDARMTFPPADLRLAAAHDLVQFVAQFLEVNYAARVIEHVGAGAQKYPAIIEL